jgi:hypothetical protein
MKQTAGQVNPLMKPRKGRMTEGNMGCPHEEGLDYPHGEDCRSSKGKEASNPKD